MILCIDPERCTGCLACQVFCSLAHEGCVNPSLARIAIHQDEIRQVVVPVTCIPCPEKSCLAACPESGALVINPAGMVVIDERYCTGCSRCIRACPIQAIRLHRLPGRGKNGQAVALKCDRCDGDPWCIRVCPTAAISVAKEGSTGQESMDRIASGLAILHPKVITRARKDIPHA
jgi:Fe-S-cluster-containing hydrogenase component 2